MAAKKRKPIQVSKDRLRIADMLLSGMSQQEIGAELHMKQQMVSYEKRAIERQWRESREKDIDTLMAREIKHIERLFREAIRGWERSFGKKETTKAAKSKSAEKPGEESASKIQEELIGDVRFLMAARELRKDMRELLGLETPKGLILPPGKKLVIEDEG